MTFAGLTAAQLALLFAGGAGILTVLYLLKLRRRDVVVVFLDFWQHAAQETQADSLFKRLRRWLSLALQLVLLALLALAIADPRLGSSWLTEQRTLLLIDTSASMKTADGAQGESRLAQGLRIAR